MSTDKPTVPFEDKVKAALADKKVTVDELRDVAMEAKANDGIVDDNEFTKLQILRSNALEKAKSQVEKDAINGVMVDVLSSKQLMILLKNDTLKWMTVVITLIFFAVFSMAQNYIK